MHTVYVRIYEADKITFQTRGEVLKGIIFSFTQNILLYYNKGDNDMKKRILALLMTLTAVTAFSSCMGNEDAGVVTDTSSQTVVETATTEAETTLPETTTEITTTEKVQETEALETTEKAPVQDDIGPLFRQYVIDEISDGSYTMKFKQMGVRLITTIDGGNSVIESNASGILQITLVNKDGRYFMLVPTTKKYVEMSADEYAEQVESFNSVSVSFEGIELTETGEETVRGVTYKTETYDEGDRGIVTYYFTDDGLKKLKSVKDGKVNDVEAFEISSDVDVSVFEIPDGYIEVSDPGEVLLP